MRLTPLAAVVILTLVPVQNAGAQAPPGVRCAFDSIATELVTGMPNDFAGVVYGYDVSANPGDQVSLRCFLTVDGVEVASTPTATGLALAVTYGPVAYRADDGQVVQLCADWTQGAAGGTTCDFWDTGPWPPEGWPDAVIWALGTVFGVTDQVVCDQPLLRPGVPGVVEAHDGGDIWVGGAPFYDCPPFDTPG